jgi:uncharacterized repeat protein (TIGR01451 family)
LTSLFGLACFLEVVKRVIVKLLKLLILPLIIIGVISFLAVHQPAIAAPPDQPGKGVISPVAQANGISLDKQASAKTIQLGQVVTYTVTIKNAGQRTIDFTLTDEMPQGLSLALQSHSISATLGTFDNQNNTLTWSGSLPQNQTATVTYHAIPPSTAEPGQTLNNVAQLKFGETTLEASASITTESKDLGIWGAFVNFIALSLVFLDNMIGGWGIPYAFGFAIILFTVVIRAAT